MKTPIPTCLALILLTAAMADDSDVLHPDYLNRISYVDSEQLNKIFSSGLLELHRAGKAEKMTVLRQQLSRKRCDVRLPAVTKSAMPPVELYRKSKGAVLIVGSLQRCKKCSKWHSASLATGYLVTPGGILVTNYHVVDRGEADLLGAMSHDGEVYPVTAVLAADKEADIAVLQLEGDGFPYLRLSPDCPIGSKVWVISNPAKQFFTFTEGMVSGRHIKNAKGEQSKRFSVTADYGGGSSGAPVLNEYGNVVGMVTGSMVVANDPQPHSMNLQAGYPEMVFNYCTPSELILQLFPDERE